VPARRIGRRVGAVGVVLVATALLAPSRVGASAAPTASATQGVTRHSIVVGGILGDSASKGAEIGAQARFARANARGGIGGRRIEFRGAAAVDDPAGGGFGARVAELSNEVFAFVPALGSSLDTPSLARSRRPFFGVADPTWAGNRFGFSFVGVHDAAGATTLDPTWGLQLRALLGTTHAKRAAIVVDDDAAGTARADVARRALRRAGFTVATPLRVAAASTPAPDLAAIASKLVSNAPFSNLGGGAVTITVRPFCSRATTAAS